MAVAGSENAMRADQPQGVALRNLSALPAARAAHAGTYCASPPPRSLEYDTRMAYLRAFAWPGPRDRHLAHD